MICIHCPNSRTVGALLCCETLYSWTPPSQISESTRRECKSLPCTRPSLVWAFRPSVSGSEVTPVCLGLAAWLGKQLVSSIVHTLTYVQSLCIGLALTNGLGWVHRECLWDSEACLPPSRPLNCCLSTHVPWFMARGPQTCAYSVHYAVFLSPQAVFLARGVVD